MLRRVTKLYEYPRDVKDSTQNTGICFGADIDKEKKVPCLGTVRGVSNCFATGKKHALCNIEVSDESDYETKFSELQDVLKTKCLVTLYDNAVCYWHNNLIDLN